jgi:hypothetical protein
VHSDQSAQSPEGTCTACTVNMSDPNPAAAFPKPLVFGITCEHLCSSNTHVCSPPLSLNLRVPCTQT